MKRYEKENDVSSVKLQINVRRRIKNYHQIAQKMLTKVATDNCDKNNVLISDKSVSVK